MYNMLMVEKHPFGNFVPPNTKYLFLGTFTGKPEKEYDWFYSSRRNQFWSILEAVYKIDLSTKKEKQELFNNLGMAITDIILSCGRKSGNNSDTNLIDMVYNTQAIIDIFQKNKIKTVYFSSRFAEKLFGKHFKSLVNQNPQVSFVTLPSPSPRYARMSKAQKVVVYTDLLPKLNP